MSAPSGLPPVSPWILICAGHCVRADALSRGVNPDTVTIRRINSLTPSPFSRPFTTQTPFPAEEESPAGPPTRRRPGRAGAHRTLASTPTRRHEPCHRHQPGKSRGYSFGEPAKILGIRRESVCERALKARTLITETQRPARRGQPARAPQGQPHTSGTLRPSRNRRTSSGRSSLNSPAPQREDFTRHLPHRDHRPARPGQRRSARTGPATGGFHVHPSAREHQ